MVAGLYAAGLRRSEAVGFDLSDFDAETGELRIRGKGRKERTAYATNGSLNALRAWLRARRSEPGPLLCPSTARRRARQTQELGGRGTTVHLESRNRSSKTPGPLHDVLPGELVIPASPMLSPPRSRSSRLF